MKPIIERISRQDRPPAVTRVIRLRSVGPHDVFSGVILNEAMYGFFVHWDGQGNKPCWNGQAHCPGCDHEQPRRWKGIIELWEGGNAIPFFIDLTPLAVTEFNERLGDEPMRGQKVHVQRERKARRAPIKVTLLDRHTGKLPKAHDPWDTLCVIWGLKR